MELKKVFEPGKIGNLELKNRLVVSAMSSHMGNPDGTPNETVNAYLVAKVKGGWGLIFTEDLGITADAGSDPVVGSLWNDDQVPAWTETVRQVHAAGGLMGAQLYHAGRQRSLKAYDTYPVAPSALKEPAVPNVPRALTVEEIHGLVAAFGEAAARAKKCGFDCVEIHGAHGYLINQFMSTFSNKRTDEYGGTLENRMRFALEVVDAVRAAVGPDYPVLFRFNTCDYVEGGIELPEAIVMAKMLEEAGVDALHCTQGMFASSRRSSRRASSRSCTMRKMPPPSSARSRSRCWRSAATTISICPRLCCATRRPTSSSWRAPRSPIPSCRTRPRPARPRRSSTALAATRAAPARPPLATASTASPTPHTCRETEYDLSIVAEPKKVFVAGAGVAGLAAAYGAAERGHKVTVFEASDEIGGQWLSAMTPPGKSEYASLILNYRNQLKKYGAQIRLETPLTREIVEAEKPDAVILATGGTPMFLPIPGLDNREFVKTAIEVLRGRTLYGKRVVVAGGGMTGAETAVFLAVQGCDVTMIEMAPDIITDAVAQPRACLLEHIRKYNVKVHTHTKLTKVGEGTVYAEEYGEPITFKHIDMLVNAMGVRSYNPLQEQLAGLTARSSSWATPAAPKTATRTSARGFNAGNAI